ncbi:glycosyltransferase [Geoalkalibacter ferrihydriticus]|nr:glycosyltransferase [Geoalkalibacter ferrihydriticus]
MEKLKKNDDCKFKVSIVIPTFNNEEYILDALESVINQSYKNIEIVVVDDGSTDGTQYALEKYKNKIKYIYQKNRGVSAARNKGISVSTGDFICFLDSDDIFEKNKIEKQLKIHKENEQLCVSYTDMAIFNGGKNFEKSYHKKNNMNCQSGFIFKNVVLGNIISTITVMIKREVFNNVGLFDESLNIGEDYDMWLRIASQYEVGYVPEVLSFYRRGHQSLTTRKPTSTFREPVLVSIIKKHLALNKDLKKQIPIVKLRRRLFQPYFDSGWSQYHAGNFFLSFNYFKAGLRYWPLNLKTYFYCIACLVGNYLNKNKIMKK